MTDELEEKPVSQEEQQTTSDVPAVAVDSMESTPVEVATGEQAVPTTEQGTAKDLVTNSSQQMFDNFVNKNYTPEQKEEIYRQIEDARNATNGNFKAAWQGKDDDEFDKVEVTYRNGKMTNFEMHNRDTDETAQIDRHIEYGEKKHSARVSQKETIDRDGTKSTTKTSVKAHDDNSFKAKDMTSYSESHTNTSINEPSHHSSKTKATHTVRGDDDGGLMLKDKQSQRTVDVGERTELNAKGNTHRIEYDADGNVTKTKDTQTSLQLGSTNQFTSERTTNTTKYNEDGDVVKAKTAQTNISIGEKNQYASATHAERKTVDEDGNVVKTRVTDNNITVDEHGINEQYQTTRTTVNDDGTQTAHTNSLGVSFDGTTVTGNAGHSKQEIAADGTVTEEHSHDLALSAGRVNGAKVDIDHKDAEHESHFTAGARLGAGVVGADFENSYRDDNKEIRTQMHADFDMAQRHADASVNLLSKHITEEGTKEKSFNAEAHVDTGHVDMAFNNQSHFTDNEGQVIAQNQTTANLHAGPHNASLSFSSDRTDETGTEKRNLNTGFTMADGKLDAKYHTAHNQTDADGQAVVTNLTDLAVAGDKKGFTAEAKKQNDGHIVENSAHASIRGMPEAGVSHSVSDNGEVKQQMKIDTDKAYAVLGEIAQNGISQVAGLTQQAENTTTQTQQALESTKDSVQNFAFMQQLQSRSM